MTTYQVIGQCAHVTVAGLGGGLQKQLLYKGSVLPSTATADEVRHLLDINAIAAIDGDPLGTHDVSGAGGGGGPAGLDGRVLADPDEVGASTPHLAKPVKPELDVEDPATSEVEARRTAAREKLAELGGKAPDGRQSKDVLVEYLASTGGNYDDLIKAEKADLVEMVKSRQS